MVVFIDCRLTERKCGTASLVKLVAKEEELLIVTVNKAISKFINNTDAKHVSEAFKRIKDVTCNDCSLSDFIVDAKEFNLHALNSKSTPIFDKGIDITLTPIKHANTTAKKTKVCAHSLLMKEVQLELNYCKRDVKDVNKEPEINEKTMDKAHEVFEDVELGCWSNNQKDNLTKNADHLMKGLCFMQKYWKVLLGSECPHIPAGDFDSSKLLNAIVGLNRKKKNE